MGWLYQLRARLAQAGLLPASKLALTAWYLLGLDIFLFLLQRIANVFRLSWGASLGGWVTALSLAVIVLFVILALRWMKAKLLWRLRNRLIVTYIFIGVIPVILLAVLALGSFYLFAGQFATFIVTSSLDAELNNLEAKTSATAANITAQVPLSAGRTATLPPTSIPSGDCQTEAEVGESQPANTASASVTPAVPTYLKFPFRSIIRDRGALFLRAGRRISVRNRAIAVFCSQPLDQHLLNSLAANLGQVTLITSGLTLRKRSEYEYVLYVSKDLPAGATAGLVPPPVQRFDFQVTLPTTITVIDWDTGANGNLAEIIVQTRISKLYERLFTSLGPLAPVVESVLLLVAIVFGIIELVALFIGMRLNSSITGAVARLYEATGHINRGEFSHRIPVTSNDQLATLAKSFNSMTESLEKLIVEQKEKQRMENELVIAQEVQAQLFPRHISQLPTLEVFGFCRPARTVSGDYYDFLAMDSDKLLLAVGDISGKGIAAALLMATVHSAVRAYSLEGVPILREPVGAGISSASNIMLGSTLQGVEVSPAALLALLNHQLFESTPMEKYATLFLAVYDGQQRKLVYSNAGHLPPLILSGDRGVRRLNQGGTVVGLIDDQSYSEACEPLHRGDLFLAYSDGVTEPENEFGEFGEDRLVDLVRENRDLPLPKITELVTAAVDDWIGDAEQPDDVTLVLARAR